MAADWPDKAFEQERLFYCSRCGAMPGRPCLTRSGLVAGSHHVDRIHKANAEWSRHLDGAK